MTFKEFVAESWNYGFPYEVKAVKNKQVVATRVIKNTQDFELAQSWFQQYLQQGCKFEKQFLFSTFEETHPTKQQVDRLNLQSLD